VKKVSYGNFFGNNGINLKELLKKIELHIIIVFNVFNACCLLHNLILGRKEVDVEELVQDPN
jgi:hypothetical protein